MKRRAFLSAAATAGAAAAVAAWPPFLREAFADNTADSPDKLAKDRREAEAEARRDRLAEVSEGYRRGQRAGKPLLVLIIPADSSEKWQRGHDFGTWLNHGTPEQLYALSLCEVMCAGMDDLRTLVPTIGFGEPLMILVETDRVPATVRRLESKLHSAKEESRGFPRNRSDWEEQEKRESAAIGRRSATLGQLVAATLIGDAAALEQRVTQLRSVRPAGELDAVEPIESKLGTLSSADADRAAPILALHGLRGSPAVRTAVQELLAKAVEKRLRSTRVPGSYWAQSFGCGTTIEEAPDRSAMIACGMGHVPEQSRRFLYFFTVPKSGPIW